MHSQVKGLRDQKIIKSSECDDLCLFKKLRKYIATFIPLLNMMGNSDWYYGPLAHIQTEFSA